jgi:hypothetical protein
MLGLCIVLLSAAVVLKFIPMGTQARTWVGLGEVVAATLSGVAFGLVSTRKA